MTPLSEFLFLFGFAVYATFGWAAKIDWWIDNRSRRWVEYSGDVLLIDLTTFLSSTLLIVHTTELSLR